LARVTYAPYVDGIGSIRALNVRVGHELARNLRGYLDVTGQMEDFNPPAPSSSAFGVFATAGISIAF